MSIYLKHKVVYLMGFSLLLSCAQKSRNEGITPQETFSFARYQTELMLDEIRKAETAGESLISPRTLKNGELRLVSSADWTSGFLPGVLWFLYEDSKKEVWKQRAIEFTGKMEREQWNAKTHDMGFKINCSFGNGYRLTGDEEYKEVIVQSAKTLITRFNPTVGSIRSWDHNKDKWQFPVIVDNMMNLELLFLATRLTGDSVFYDVAVAHANTTMKNHYRDDNSSYHVINYDTLTGAILDKHTHQGYAHESAWSRGQAWGLYGYALCFRETGDEKYLKQAIKIAEYILNHPNMPEDLVPYWDFDAPDIPAEPRDASAAAVTASALYELSTYVPDGSEYRYKADKMIESLSSKYISDRGANKGFILDHSTGSKPGDSEIDVPLSYADYYFLEALLRKVSLEKTGQLVH